MNQTNVPVFADADAAGAAGACDAALARIAALLEELPAALHRAAVHLLDHPRDIGICTVREMAAAAGVKPNSLVRLARSAGFEGYDALRQPFREALRRGDDDFPDRARWLQSLARGGRHGALFAGMAESAIGNIERSFAGTDAGRFRAAARAVLRARRVHVLGMGVNHPLASGFAALAGMALDHVRAIPTPGGTAVDDLAHAGPRDLLIAMTFRPYRAEVLQAVAAARGQGMAVIGLSDSPSSPLLVGNPHGFLIAVETPQFFPSTLAAAALLETLMAFIVADSGNDVVANIESVHRRRHALGLYRDPWEAPG